MAKRIYRTAPHTKEFADAINGVRAQIGPGAFFHLDAYEQPIASGVATDLPSVLALVNEEMTVYLAHLGDTLAHKAADPAPAVTKATDLPTSLALANAIKADYNAHRASTTYNYNADSTNTVTAADATDLASAITLTTALKTAINAHLASAPAGYSLRVLSA